MLKNSTEKQQAKTILGKFRVGDNIHCLVKYGNNFNTSPCIIIGRKSSTGSNTVFDDSYDVVIVSAGGVKYELPASVVMEADKEETFVLPWMG